MGLTPDPVSRSDAALTCRGVRKYYGSVRAVDGVDLEVRHGECFGLLGPNGAGKTTTVEMLAGLTAPDEGEVMVLGRHWGGRGDRHLRQRLGVQLQETQLPDKLTVVEVLRLFASFYHRPRAVDDVLADVELEDKRRARVGKLSGGQRQRLALACALVGEPEILFLDEPTTGLDPQARLKVWSVVEAFRAAGGTVLLTTHYMDEAARLASRVAIMDHGSIIAADTPSALIADLGADQVVACELTGVADPAAFTELSGVRSVTGDGAALRLHVTDIGAALPALLAAVGQRNLAIRQLATHQASLEDVFVHLTGRELRDA